MAAPTVSHLDPLMLRAARRCARAADAAVPRAGRLVRVRGLRHRHVRHGNGRREPRARRHARARSSSPGYFGDRLAQMCERYGATVTRARRRVGPRVRSRRAAARTLTGDAGRRRGDGPRRDVDRRAEPGSRAGADRARARRADDRRRGHVVRRPSARRRRAGASTPATAARRSVSARRRVSRRSSSARARSSGASSAAASTSISRCSRTTGSAGSITTRCRRRCVYALYEALAIVEEEGLDARWARHERNHRALVDGAERRSGLSLLPREGERLWTLNAVRVPDGVDEAAVRKQLLERVQHRDRRRASVRWPARSGASA